MQIPIKTYKDSLVLRNFITRKAQESATRPSLAIGEGVVWGRDYSVHSSLYEQIFTLTLGLSVQACKNASLSLANVAWYVVQSRLIAGMQSVDS